MFIENITGNWIPMTKFFCNIRLRIFFLNFSIVTLVSFLSFICAWAEDEGTLGDSILWYIGAKLFYVVSFPCITLLWGIIQFTPLVSTSLVFLYMFGMIFNLVFYALSIERLLYFIKIKKAGINSA